MTTPTLGRVIWTSNARQDLSPAFVNQVAAELLTVYPKASIIVKQRFHGYRDEPHEKLILAIEVQTTMGNAGENSLQTHSNVVKLGVVKEVGGDSAAWQACAADRGTTSRLFIAPHSVALPNDRVLIAYPDAYQFYFDDGSENEPAEFQDVVESAVKYARVSANSIERILTQVFTEAHRCFYRYAHEEAVSDKDQAAKALGGITAALHPDDKPPVFEIWQGQDYLKLRRGAAWLTGGQRKPESLARPDYIDPVDTLAWALKHHQLPPMLVGPSHGDLHGRNIIVGVVRGEAEWPAVIDLDKMSNQNLVAWDFAKLELELKIRIFQQFVESPQARQQVRAALGLPPSPAIPESIRKSPQHRVALRAERLQIMFAIEQRLQQWTDEISSLGQGHGIDDELSNAVDPDSSIGRALQIVFRIRREAAIHLGYVRQGREQRWRDEYYFALMAYGVITAKWHSASDQLAWALMSSGVAAASLTQLPWPPSAEVNPDVEQVPSYFHLLPWAARLWEEGNWDKPRCVLRAGIERFPYAVALRQQLALSLAQSPSEADEEEARREIAELADLAIVFRDHETLCRLGRVFKDRGDRCFDGQQSLDAVIRYAFPMVQIYRAALKYYLTASEVSDYDYYPTINAATLGLLVGDQPLSHSLAEKVLERCAGYDTDRPDRTWILASEGEASLLLGRTGQAINFCSQALHRILPTEIGILQSIYDQLCRLHWALGPTIVGPLIDHFQATGKLATLKPGPFGNCGR